MSDEILRIEHVSKKYRLGMIGGTSLREELQRKRAARKGLEDPTRKVTDTSTGKIGEEFLALRDINLTIHQGERVGIIGHNGAGKSTLLKLISRITAPSTGSISMNGRVASMLEVGTGFHRELTGRENIYMNGAILGMTKAEIDEKMEDIIEFSECRKFIDTPVKRYSSGMYVKLAFAVAAHLDAEIMIMDEVLAVGDVAFQRKCLDKMSQVSRDEGRTILYVSHNMSTIRQLCERCVVLDHGTVIFDGNVDEAITLYLGRDLSSLETDIDLSRSRMPHLPGTAKAKIKRVRLLGKTEALYAQDEPLKLEVSVHSDVEIQKPCFRMELRSSSDIRLGTSIIQTLPAVRANSDSVYTFTFNTKGIAPGRYMALLVYYDVNDFRVKHDYDAVWPAFAFDVVDSAGENQINWSSNFGMIRFEELVLDAYEQKTTD